MKIREIRGGPKIVSYKLGSKDAPFDTESNEWLHGPVRGLVTEIDLIWQAARVEKCNKVGFEGEVDVRL